MTDIVIQTKLNGDTVNGLTDPPEITVYRLDTDAVVVNAAAMSDVGAGGFYKFAFGGFAISGISYAFDVDADPNDTGQVTDKVYGGVFDYDLHDLWVDKGLNPNDPKDLFENVEGSDYTQTASDGVRGPDVDKTVVKVGATTTTTRV